MKIAKLLLFTVILTSLLGCSVPRYTISTSDDAPIHIVKGFRVIILSDFIISGNKPLFERTIQLLGIREYEELESFLANGTYPKDDVELCRALMCFNQGKYEDAAIYLDNIKDFKYECLVKLLKTDIEYEMMLSEGLISPVRVWEQIEPQERAKNRSLLLDKYQEVFDCDSSDDNHYMIKMRVKQLKYAQ